VAFVAFEQGMPGRFSAPFTAVGSSSFVDFLSAAAPDLLPGRRPLPPGSAEHLGAHATTIIALNYADGVLMAGDRRATMGNLISQRNIEKVQAADDYSLIGYAGTAGIAIEMVRLYQVELEHYERLNGTPLTLDGKANRLAAMVRGNLGLAMQGLAAIPLFAGYDLDPDAERPGRIFSYDPAGAFHEETGYDGVGSGSLFAKGTLKKRWRSGLTRDQAVQLAVDALYDAADEDSATGGPDVSRQIFPTVFVVTADGVEQIEDAAVAAVAEAVIAARLDNPGGVA
jgi:proteasome beta subunit